MSQFADDTNLFCADLISVENALKTVGDFGRLAGLKLNMKKSKAIWLGKWETNKSHPLQLKWLHSPVRLLGIHVSYDEKGNNELNFNLKIRKLQTNLDMWRSRDLNLFGKVLIIKSLGLSQLIYSASILNVPEDIKNTNEKSGKTESWHMGRSHQNRESPQCVHSCVLGQRLVLNI